MKSSMLASALSLLIGSGIAVANDTEVSKPAQPAQTSDTSKDMPKDMSKDVQNVDLFFDTDSAVLSADANADLKKLADWAKCNSHNAVILEGYADPRGTIEHNQKLSAARAASVRQALLDAGVPSRRIVISVYGENGPKRGSNQQARRVTAQAKTTPITPDDLSG